MKNLQDIFEIIEQEISNLTYPKSPELLYNPIDYIMGLRAKRIRPILVLLSYQLFNENIKKALSPAIAIELFHNFTLLHDDIMDHAPLRRGHPTVHEKWDNNIAILSGDVMMIYAYQLLSKVDSDSLQEVLSVFSKGAVKVCEGQQLDMQFETKEDIHLADYMKMIEYKTAVLLATSLEIGAIVGKANEKERKHLYEFGINIGIAFQLKDDLLDVFGDPKIFGKKLGGDIIANKKTFLYLKAIQLADHAIKQKLTYYYKQNECFEEKITLVKEIFNSLDIRNHTLNMMRAYYTKAMKHLDAINSKAKEPLMLFSKQLMDRIS